MAVDGGTISGHRATQNSTISGVTGTSARALSEWLACAEVPWSMRTKSGLFSGILFELFCPPQLTNELASLEKRVVLLQKRDRFGSKKISALCKSLFQHVSIPIETLSVLSEIAGTFKL
ncbi:hypothetical protein [Ruegeria hyattellae]|uniref:hypothetical protein n=1 Tax=Ruegeria hyattellae TaxID=3233337 RepID=UPI00355C13A4